MRKGQTAMEYLMTYGWAILIILIVGGLLVYYGVFAIKPGASKQGFGLLDLLSPWDYKDDGNLTYKIQNRVGYVVELYAIEITDPAVGGTPNTTVYNPVITIAAGGASNWLSANSSVLGSSGDAYNIGVTLRYNVGTENFSSTGTLSETRS